MKKVLILGHNGMLGNSVYKYFKSINKYDVSIIDSRYGQDLFLKDIQSIAPDFIINCIGKIPQRKEDIQSYEEINLNLVIFLDKLNIKIVHPTTDCEFSGKINNNIKYSKFDIRDAEDQYGISKSKASIYLENSSMNTKIIRTSIIGHEKETHVSLLDWFLHTEVTLSGYINHLWNGVTTLEWSKFCEKIIDDWENFPILNQIGTGDMVSKYQLLTIIKYVYDHNVIIEKFETDESLNKCLESDFDLKDIKQQLIELKSFYKK